MVLDRIRHRRHRKTLGTRNADAAAVGYKQHDVPETFVFVPRNAPVNAKPLAIYSTVEIPVIIGDAEEYRKQLEELLPEAVDAVDGGGTAAAAINGDALSITGSDSAAAKKQKSALKLLPSRKPGTPNNFEQNKLSKKERKLSRALPPFPPGVDASDALSRPADAVEYHIDEEDDMFLRLLNCDRQHKQKKLLTEKPFELVMDYFEKADELQVKEAIAKKAIDEDAVCCVCLNGDSYDMNAIMFCDLCNMAVHQECYGVPYLPEGQWLCRKCLQSPTAPVKCVLCPNEGGAFKRTDDNRWCHIVCALWIPEVEFVNTVFLEPITGINKVDPERWKLKCEACKQQPSQGENGEAGGACIQCCVKNCAHAYHVTCAQEHGFHLEIKEAPPNCAHIPRYIDGVEKTTYCKVHSRKFDKLRTPPGKRQEAQKRRAAEMKRDLQSLHQTLLTPERVKELRQKLTELANDTEKEEFIYEIHKYWQLKREARSGVPLLRRLVVQTQSSRMASEQLVLNMRRSFDRFRHLCDLLDRHQRDPSILERLTLYDFIIDPVGFLLRGCVRKVRQLDLDSVFLEPVPQDVPGYYDVIQQPISLRDMDEKIERGEYSSVDELKRDFKLMIDNCKAFNPKDHPYHALAEFIEYTATHDIFARALRTEKALLTRRAPRTFKADATSSSMPNLQFVQDVFLSFLKEFEPDFAAEFEKQLEKEGRLNKVNQSVLGSVMAALNRSLAEGGAAGDGGGTSASAGTVGDAEHQSLMSLVSSAALDGGDDAAAAARRRSARTTTTATAGPAQQQQRRPNSNARTMSGAVGAGDNAADEALVFRRPHDVVVSQSSPSRRSAAGGRDGSLAPSDKHSQYYADDDAVMDAAAGGSGAATAAVINPHEQPFTRFLPREMGANMSPPSFITEATVPDELKTNKFRMEPLPASLLSASAASLKRRGGAGSPSPPSAQLNGKNAKKPARSSNKRLRLSNGGTRRRTTNGLPPLNIEDGLTSTTTTDGGGTDAENLGVTTEAGEPTTDDFNTTELENSDVNQSTLALNGASSQLQPGAAGAVGGSAAAARSSRIRSQRSAAASATVRMLKLSANKTRKLLLEDLEPHEFVWARIPGSQSAAKSATSAAAAENLAENDHHNELQGGKILYPAVIRMTPRAAKGSAPAAIDASALENMAKQFPNAARVRELITETLINPPQRMILNRRDDTDRYLVVTFHKAPQWHWIARADVQRMFSESHFDRSTIQQATALSKRGSSNSAAAAAADAEDSVEAAHRRAAQLKDLIMYAGSGERERVKEEQQQASVRQSDNVGGGGDSKDSRTARSSGSGQQQRQRKSSTSAARAGAATESAASSSSTAVSSALTKGGGGAVAAARAAAAASGGTRNPRSRSPSKSRGASVSTQANA